MLDEIINRIHSKTPQEQGQIIKIVEQAREGLKWIPNPGPQTEAYFSKADILFYGGSAGGGKSDLGLGLAITAHKRSLIMRRQYTDLSFLTDRALQIMGTRKGFNGAAPPKFQISNDQLIEYGACTNSGDELSWMGRPHDLLYIDEVTHFLETQVRTLMGWVRSPDPKQRVRVVFGSNPPFSGQENFVFKMFAPWFDPAYPNPAKVGELRWCIVDDDGQDIWVDGPGLYDKKGNLVSNDTSVELDGTVTALSRTFIRAKLSDNPFQNTASYRATLDGLPSYMRAAVRDGEFLQAYKDHRFQLIPTLWIKQSMDAWKPDPPEGVPMCVISADLTGITDEMSEAKPDKFTIASRHDGYFNDLVVFNASEVNSGAEKAAAILKYRRDGAQIILDMGGGYGDATYEHLKNNGEEVIKYKGSAESKRRTRKSQIAYYNKRADVYYSFMEDLDPNQAGGCRITLPPNKLLMADLCSIRFDAGNEDSRIIKLETKKDLRKRLGRSTDYSDPTVVAWSVGAKIASHYEEWEERKRYMGGRTPRVITRKP